MTSLLLNGSKAKRGDHSDNTFSCKTEKSLDKSAYDWRYAGVSKVVWFITMRTVYEAAFDRKCATNMRRDLHQSRLKATYKPMKSASRSKQSDSFTSVQTMSYISSKKMQYKITALQYK